ncbi:VanZ family protein [Bacillus sp. FJAT-29814]|uniref:VanZ family protein n=1 Tax=Bacillus sp. FJAT-29814 TaxID=1729688 RepID=UPI00083124C1|nr:VanZ family protein [Bacillus sp. FJAT-29814]
MGKRKWWAVAAVIWMAGIYCFTQLPYFTGANTSKVIHKVVEKEHETINTPSADNKEINIINLIVRKSTHVLVFGILSLLLFKALEPYRYSFLLAWFLTILYAITDEYHQSFMPGRVATYKDVLYDSFGALVALILIVAIKNRKQNVRYR